MPRGRYQRRWVEYLAATRMRTLPVRSTQGTTQEVFRWGRESSAWQGTSSVRQEVGQDAGGACCPSPSSWARAWSCADRLAVHDTRRVRAGRKRDVAISPTTGTRSLPTARPLPTGPRAARSAVSWTDGPSPAATIFTGGGSKDPTGHQPVGVEGRRGRPSRQGQPAAQLSRPATRCQAPAGRELSERHRRPEWEWRHRTGRPSPYVRGPVLRLGPLRQQR